MISIPTDTYLTAKKKIKEQYVGTILGNSVNIVLLFVGIYWWGLLGLVVARVIARFSSAIISIFLYNKASKNQSKT
jgi:O-antigen/teichoic acid export membrane protein